VRNFDRINLPAKSWGISKVFADQPPARAPIQQLVQVSEIVDALPYLQSAPMMNGENIRIDGGAHAGAKWKTSCRTQHKFAC
jgi:NAD(P)-dependent dehydrogenase (short-subunit alcohol dehydrogenase family)